MAKPRNEGLTKRKFDVLKLLYFKKPEIAKKLFISTSTVKAHINNIYCKLCVHNSAQALIKALKDRIITLDDIETVEVIGNIYENKSLLESEG